jgi:hypothetical protein
MASAFYNGQADAASAACNNLTIKGVTASADDAMFLKIPSITI